jgi:serine/threonine-protein kinase
LISFDGAVKLSDFGVAVSSVTREGESLVTGKWAYMSPEQTLAQPLDHRSDLFSLGIVLYQLLGGSHPFGAPEIRDVVMKLRRGHFVPLAERRPDLPEGLDWLVSQLLSVDPERRPPHGQAVAGAISEIARRDRIDLRTEAAAALLAEIFPDQGGSRTSLPPESVFLVKQTASNLHTPNTGTGETESKTATLAGESTTRAEGDGAEGDSSSYRHLEIEDRDREPEIEMSANEDEDEDEPAPEATHAPPPRGVAVDKPLSSMTTIAIAVLVAALTVLAYVLIGSLL